MAIGNKKIENYLPVVKQNQGIKTAYPISTTSTFAATGAATAASYSATGAVTTRSGTAVAAVASGTPAALSLYSDAINIYAGTGSPNTVLTAAKGSLYVRTDGSSTSTRLYVNTDGVTAWTNFTSAA